MMMCSLLIFYALLLVFFAPVSGQQKEGKLERAFTKISTAPGSRDASLVNLYGKRWKLRVSFPENKDSKKQPGLIIALHWAGGADTYKEFHDCLALPGFKELNAILVAPEGESQLWNTVNNIEKVMALIANAKKYWNVAPDKIAVMGYSNGGNGSWYFAEHYPKLFSAAIPMASAYAVSTKIAVPLYVIHGAKDDLFPVNRTKKWVMATQEKGTAITLKVNPELSHFEACNYVQELQQAGNWLQNIWTPK